MQSSTRRHFLTSCLCTAAASLLTAPARAGDAPLAVVVGKNTPIDALSRAELKRLFLGEASSIGGASLFPFNADPASSRRVLFDQKVLGFAPNQSSKYWIDRRIRGEGAAPRTAPTAEVQAKVAARYAHAITYLPLDLVTPEMKVLRVDGKLPTEPGYLIATQ